MRQTIQKRKSILLRGKDLRLSRHLAWFVVTSVLLTSCARFAQLSLAKVILTKPQSGALVILALLVGLLVLTVTNPIRAKE